MSCNSFTQIPTPPTTQPSCALPIGGSNSSILDACCNSHINALPLYAPPNTSPSSPARNSASDDGCFQYCAPQDILAVRSCLSQKLGAYRSDGKGPTFECFNVDASGKRGGGEDGSEGAYGSAAAGRARGSVGWTMGVVIGLGLVGSVVGVV